MRKLGSSKFVVINTVGFWCSAQRRMFPLKKSSGAIFYKLSTLHSVLTNSWHLNTTQWTQLPDQCYFFNLFFFLQIVYNPKYIRRAFINLTFIYTG